MRRLYPDMRICIDLPLPYLVVECTTLYLMPLDLNLFLEFHRSECQLDLQRVYVFQGHSTAAADFQKTGSNL